MNDRSVHLRPVVAASWAELLALLNDCVCVGRRHGAWAVAALGAAVITLVLVYPHDRAWLAAVQSCFHCEAGTRARAVAWQLGRWGDYPTYNLPVAMLIWLYGLASGERRWCRVALVALLAASLAGLFDDCFRLTLGRPRPDVMPPVPDGFYGPLKSIHGRYQSFPSGHAASDVAMAVALLFVCRPLGLVASVFAAAVIWGRLELNKHYPSDVLVGSIIGLYFGALVGGADRQAEAGSGSAVTAPA